MYAWNSSDFLRNRLTDNVYFYWSSQPWALSAYWYIAAYTFVFYRYLSFSSCVRGPLDDVMSGSKCNGLAGTCRR